MAATQSEKSAKFFCENCGAEVPQNAKVCKKCGRFFSSVRCPACGKTGRPDEFTSGCPSCGYAEGKTPSSNKKNNNLNYYYEKPKLTKNKKRNIRNAFNSYNKKNTSSDEKVPAWIFILSVAVLVTVFILLVLKF